MDKWIKRMIMIEKDEKAEKDGTIRTVNMSSDLTITKIHKYINVC